MNSTLTSITKNFINLIYPMRCASCGKDLDSMNEAGVCAFCIGRIRRNPKPHCHSCGRSITDGQNPCRECVKADFVFTRAYSACLYEDPLKGLISEFKYKKKIRLAKILSQQLVSFVNDDPDILDGIDLMTFVPLCKESLRERGFNQAKLLADAISKDFDIPVADVLKKTKRTVFQHALSRDERMTNLNSAFSVRDPISIKNISILLVDDVMTTGTTLNECSKVLLNSGVKDVKCLTLARGI